jgi:hypothetical protein
MYGPLTAVRAIYSRRQLLTNAAIGPSPRSRRSAARYTAGAAVAASVASGAVASVALAAAWATPFNSLDHLVGQETNHRHRRLLRARRKRPRNRRPAEKA